MDTVRWTRLFYGDFDGNQGWLGFGEGCGMPHIDRRVSEPLLLAKLLQEPDTLVHRI